MSGIVIDALHMYKMISSSISILFVFTAGLMACHSQELDSGPLDTWESKEAIDNINKGRVRIKRHGQANGNSNHARVSEQIRNMLFDKYSPAYVPDTDDGTKVSLGVYIVDFGPVSSVDMSVTMTFYLRQSWIDRRLVFDWETIQSWNESKLSHLTPKEIPAQLHIVPFTQSIREKMFLPDTFFR